MPSLPRRLSIIPVVLAAALVALVAASPSSGADRATTAPAFRFAPLPGLHFTSPVWTGGAGDGTSALYVVEQGGVVWKVVGRTRTRFLDLTRVSSHDGEQGVLSIAFATDFRTSGRMYAYFTRRDGNGQVRQFTVRRGAVVPGSGRDIITVVLTNPAAANHNGGNLWARPGGLLFLSTGDGGGGGDPAGNSQRLDRLAGKLLRIAPKVGGGYAVPRSNPFVGRRGARAEIFALGLRNPFRYSIDAPTGDIWIGDVGQDTREEIDRLPGGRPAGANFGWRRMEGT
ncbi:MAG: glucose/sorbosone dehydrogenase-like protein, partial [Thermoleophilia bacterium]|nr:glucose/sorbosone dehydrogenase-like protein [Thermoleophilia bacterium]